MSSLYFVDYLLIYIYIISLYYIGNTERILLMKILKKILPAATIASIAVVVTPLATSCNNGGMSTWTVTADMFDGLTVAPYELSQGEEAPGRDKITKFYLEKVANNKQILLSDMINQWKLFYDDLPPYCTDATVSIGDVDLDNCALSYNIDYKYDFSQTNAANYLFGCQIKNFQFFCIWRSSTWMLANIVDSGMIPSADLYSYLKHCFVDWSITIQYGSMSELKQEMSISRESTEEEMQKFFNFIGEFEIYKYDSMLLIPSGYLQNIPQPS